MGQDPAAGLNVALCDARVRLRALLGRATRDEVACRYRAGAIIAEVKPSKEKYGTHAVQRLARALGQDPQPLYRYATVAEGWSATACRYANWPNCWHGAAKRAGESPRRGSCTASSRWDLLVQLRRAHQAAPAARGRGIFPFDRSA